MQLGYIILYVPNVDQTVQFYENAFGITWRFVHESGAYAEMETGETALAFISETLVDSHEFRYRRTRLESDTPSVEVAFVTQDVDEAYNRAIKVGAVAITKPENKPWGQMVGYVRDLNGYLVEICSPVIPFS